MLATVPAPLSSVVMDCLSFPSLLLTLKSFSVENHRRLKGSFSFYLCLEVIWSLYKSTLFYLFNLFFLILKSCTGRIGRGQMIQNQVTPFFLFPFIFNFMCVFAYISVHHVYAMPVATRRRYWMPWGCESWEPNLGPLDDQPVLLPSAPSLPPHNSLTWFLLIMKLPESIFSIYVRLYLFRKILAFCIK